MGDAVNGDKILHENLLIPFVGKILLIEHKICA